MTTWEPTHVQFTVCRARNLPTKGKGGSKLTDVFIAVQLAKEKFQTSTIKNALNPEWFEQCDLQLPTMNAEVQLHVMHRGMLSDDFIGYCSVPLFHYKVYERPTSQWIQLQGKPNKTPDNKYRGEIEIRVAFSVKSKQDDDSSNLNKKKSSSIKGLASAMGHKVGDKLKFVRSKSLRDPHFSSPTQKDMPPAYQSSSAVQAKTLSRILQEKEMNERIRSHSMSLRRSGEIEKGTPDNVRQYNQPGNRQSLPAAYLGTQTLPHPKGRRYGQNRRSLDDLDSTVSSQPGYLESIFRKESEVFHTMNSADHNPESSGDEDERRNYPCKSAKEYKEPNNESCDSDSEGSVDIKFPSVKQRPDSGNISDIKIEQTDYNQSSSSHLNNLSPESGIATINSSHTSVVSNDNEFKETSFPETSQEPVYHNQTPSNQEVQGLMETSGNVKERRDSLGHSKKRIAPEEKFTFGFSPDKAELPSNGHVRRRSKRDKTRGMGSRRYTVQGLDYYRRQNSLEDTLDSLRPQFMREAREVSSIPDDLVAVYRHMTKDELIRIVIQHKAQLIRKDQYVKDLEQYIDSLLVRVMEATPRILQNSNRYK